ncbi:MAG: ATP-dependent nuclease, partial [Bacteroidales bacterium]
MARLKRIQIEGYRSINEPIVVDFPPNQPAILIGENNTGKTNITRAIDLLFGEFHPRYKSLEDHDHYGRNAKRLIDIQANVSGYQGRLGRSGEFNCVGFHFSCIEGEGNDFVAIQGDDEENNYVSNELRNELTSIVVNAESNLAYQLSYASKFTLLSKVTKAFHNKLSEDEEKVKRLKDLFSQIKDTFLEVPEFSDFRNNMSSIAGEVIANMAYGLELDFTAYDPSNYFKALGVNPTENGEARNFEELGTGQQQILALSFAQAYSRSFLGDLILIIDEPEAHLHHLAQKWLARTMFQMAKDGLQIVLTTHSAHFINLEFLEGVKLIRKVENETEVVSKTKSNLYDHCIATNADKIRTQRETIIPFYANHSTSRILNGFFANKIVLVEGPTEELALPIYLEKVSLDTLKEGIEVINVAGKGNLAKWWRLFTLYDIPTFVCFDNDSRKDGNGNKRKDALKAIEIPEGEIDELLTEEHWNINDNFCVFGEDFEATMRASFKEYEAIETEAKERLGDSKHIVAREVAHELEVNNDEGWEWF